MPGWHVYNAVSLVGLILLVVVAPTALVWGVIVLAFEWLT